MHYTFSWLGNVFCCRNSISAASHNHQNPALTDQDHSEDEVEPLKANDPDQSFPEVITRQPQKINKTRPSFLCCSYSPVYEDQVDFCPHFWFHDLVQPCHNSCRNFKRFVWRLCFLFTCLPMCYPCYVTRSIRRRRKQRPKYWQTDVNDTEDLNRTILHRQVTMKEVSKNDATNMNDNQEESTPPVIKIPVININVIVLHSPAADLLHPYLKSTTPSSNLIQLPTVSFY